ncbi:MAG: DUF4395 domain-containing protein [Bacteroidales bacterium]|nr:DUF4395 domain-containing protein [Bacteroidales bacterium]
MNNLVCPVSTHKINENVSRLTAGIIFSLIILFILTQNILFLVFALFDFSFRVFEKITFSPVSWVIKNIYNAANLPKKMINKAPKIFAARLGFFLSAVSLIIFFFFPVTASIIAGVLAVCIFADAAFNFCIGCIIYHSVVYPFYKDK